jgi:pimeloyl-ACP methyl ester carboxylesterase
MSTQHTGSRDIVLIHGLWNTPKTWEGWTKRFRDRGYVVHVPSWPGLDGEPADLRRDPFRVPDVSVEQILDHYEGVIRGLDRPPIVIGHSFGGAFTQVLLDRGLGVAAVVLGSAPTKGILRLPFTTIRSLWGILKNPRNRNRAVPFTEGQFRYAFGNTLSEEESRRAWERYAVPGVGRVVFEGALANLSSSSPFKVDYAKTDRAPLLFIAEGEDNVVPAVLNRLNVAKYKEANPDALVEYKEYPSRSHFTPVEPGWEAVADDALEWAVAHAR